MGKELIGIREPNQWSIDCQPTWIEGLLNGLFNQQQRLHDRALSGTVRPSQNRHVAEIQPHRTDRRLEPATSTAVNFRSGSTIPGLAMMTPFHRPQSLIVASPNPASGGTCTICSFSAGGARSTVVAQRRMVAGAAACTCAPPLPRACYKMSTFAH